MSGLLCQTIGCPIELRLKAMEAWRAKQKENGVTPTFSTNDYNESCSMCSRLKSWQYVGGPEGGYVKAL